MKLTEIITLLKAGYTRAEIKDMEEAEKASVDSESEEKPAADESAEPEGTSTQPEKKPAAGEPEPEPDYKKLYEQSQAALEKAQAANIKKPAKEEKPVDLQKVIDDIIH